MRLAKRQWRDGGGVVHTVFGDAKLRYNQRTRLKCGGWTPTRWRSTRDAPTCFECIAPPEPKVVRLNDPDVPRYTGTFFNGGYLGGR